MSVFPDELGLDAARLFAGCAGGIVHVLTAKHYKPIAAAGAVVVGSLTANFLGPAASHIAPTWAGDHAPSFIVGYCAIFILQGVEALVRFKMRAAIERERL